MQRLNVLIVLVLLVVGLSLFCSTPVSAADTTAVQVVTEPSGSTLDINPFVLFFGLLFICIIIGILASLGGVGGGVIFTPLMMGFTPINSYIIRATGLFAALAGSLFAARAYLKRGLANIKLDLFASVPYTVFAVIGALLAGFVEKNAGDFGEAIIRLILGILVIGISGLVLFGGKRVEYPEVNKVDRFTQKLGLNMAYWEESLGKVVNYKVKRAVIAIPLFSGVGMISGMFGMGAGWAMVPVLNLVMLAPLKVAAASSSVLIGMGDTAAIWPYITGGGIFPLIAVPCMIGLVGGVLIGTRIMLRVKASYTRYIIIVLMFASGVKLLIDGVSRLY